MKEEMKRHSYTEARSLTEVKEGGEKMLKWLSDLEVFGLTILSSVPADKLAMTNLVNQMGFPKTTHYGTSFEVVAKKNPSNLAFTSSSLGLHVDLPYYESNPGVQYLHCIQQFEMDGGENEFADGFKLAAIIRKEYPEEWATLTTMPIHFWDSGHEKGLGAFYKKTALPTFQMDSLGRLTRVNYNNQVRDSMLAASSPAQVKVIYKALKLVDEIAYKKENMLEYKLKPGECVVFDNQRILHGRRGYNMDAGGGHRHLQGGFIDWDEVRSVINLIRKEMEDTKKN